VGLKVKRNSIESAFVSECLFSRRRRTLIRLAEQTKQLLALLLGEKARLSQKPGALGDNPED